MKLQLDDEVRRRIHGAQEPLRPARNHSELARRESIVESIRAARQEIAQIFIDTEYWNAHVRREHEQPIDPDPAGDLMALAAFYDRILKNDTQ